jgi:hypothetical protein
MILLPSFPSSRGRAVACARGGPPAVARRRPTAIFVRGLLRERSLFDAESRVHRAGRRLRPASVLRAEATTRPTARLSQRLPGMMRIPGRFAPSWTSTTGIPAASTAGMPPPVRPDELLCLECSTGSAWTSRSPCVGVCEHVCARARA